jgi:DNA-binding NarL/FixJ family response regulator
MAATDRRCRVLLADDTPEIRQLLRMSLEMDGRFEIVGEAEDGAAAVELTHAETPDAVILDLAMPVMDGLQAIPEILRTAPAAKILVLSGFEARQMSKEAIARGAHAYIEKGKNMKEVATLLADLCAGGPPPH